MSYCRFTEADIYVYDDVRGYLECCGCSISGSFQAETAAAMVEHIREHITAGDDVPDDVIPAILADAEADDPDRAQRRAER